MHKKDNQRLVSPLAKAKGLGSVHEGVHHWMLERITGAMLAPLSLWIVYSMVGLKGASYEVFTLWLQSPLNAVLMIMFMLTSLYHGAMGLQVILEDYISCHCLRLVKIIAVKITFAFLAIASVFSILKIAL